MKNWQKLGAGTIGFEATFPGTLIKIRVRGDDNFAHPFANLDNAYQCLPLKEGNYYWYEVEGGKLADMSSFVCGKGKKEGQLAPGTAVGFGVLYADGYAHVQNGLDVKVESTVVSFDKYYRALLGELTSAFADLQMQYTSKVADRLSVAKKPSEKHASQRLFYLLSLIRSPEFVNAVRMVVYRPASKLVSVDESVDVRHAARMSRAGLFEIASASRRMRLPVDHPLYDALKGDNGFGSIPERIRQTSRIVSTDIPENRFVKFVLEFFLGELSRLKNSIEKRKKTGSNKLLAVDIDLRDSLSMIASALGHPFFHDIGRLTRIPSSSILLQRKEGYREILKKWLQYQLGTSLAWEDGLDVYRANQRQMHALYEYWCCLKLLKIAGEVFHFDGTAQFKSLVNVDDLVIKLSKGGNVSVDGWFETPVSGIRCRKLKVRFSYNKVFSEKNAENMQLENSWTFTMKPDFTLAFWPDLGHPHDYGEAVREDLVTYVHFDAKYKVKISRVNAQTQDGDKPAGVGAVVADEEERDVKDLDIFKMHAYRDAIRRTGGSYVLFPGDKNSKLECMAYNEKFPGLGAFPLSPSVDSSKEIKSFLVNSAALLCKRVTRWEEWKRQTHEVYSSDIGDVGICAVQHVANLCETLEACHFIAPLVLPINVIGKRPEGVRWIAMKNNTGKVCMFVVKSVGYMGTLNLGTIKGKYPVLKNLYPGINGDDVFGIWKVMKGY